MKSFLTIALWLALPVLAFAQPPDTAWTRTYGGGYFDYGNSVQQTTDGGYILAGQTGSFGVDFTDIYLIRIEPKAMYGLVISADSGNAVLSWLPIGAPSYHIYGADVPFGPSGLYRFLGMVSDTTWTDPYYALKPSPYFYRVKAVW